MNSLVHDEDYMAWYRDPDAWSRDDFERAHWPPYPPEKVPLFEDEEQFIRAHSGPEGEGIPCSPCDARGRRWTFGVDDVVAHWASREEAEALGFLMGAGGSRVLAAPLGIRYSAGPGGADVRTTRLLESGLGVDLDSPEPVIGITNSPWSDLTVHGERVAYFGFGCPTCAALFVKYRDPPGKLEIEQVCDALNEGLDGIDAQIVEVFGELLPPGRYQPLLLEIHPWYVEPGQPGDYFKERCGWEHWDQMDPKTPYFRGGEWQLGERFQGGFKVYRDGLRFFEFVLPLFSPAANDRSRVEFYTSLLTETSKPTAVAVSSLIARQAADWRSREDGLLVHWTMTHALLDGHHKVAAAAEFGRPLRLLALVMEDQSGLSPLGPDTVHEFYA